MYIFVKLSFTAGLIVLITEVAKRSDKFGGLIAAMPIITILAILWMYFVDALWVCGTAEYRECDDCVCGEWR